MKHPLIETRLPRFMDHDEESIRKLCQPITQSRAERQGKMGIALRRSRQAKQELHALTAQALDLGGRIKPEPVYQYMQHMHRVLAQQQLSLTQLMRLAY